MRDRPTRLLLPTRQACWPTALASARGGASNQSTYAVAAGSDYDGTNDFQARGADLTGIADGKAGTLSVWFRLDGSDGISRLIVATAGGGGFTVAVNSGGFPAIVARSDASVILLNIASSAVFAGAAWQHILGSWDLAAGAAHFLVNGSAVGQGVITLVNDGTVIDYTHTNWFIGAANPTGSNKFNGCLAELFFHTTYIDLSNMANVRKFIDENKEPVNLGADGSTPLGVQPLLYVPSGDASGTGNKGTGGAFTTTGALTAADTLPGYPR